MQSMAGWRRHEAVYSCPSIGEEITESRLFFPIIALALVLLFDLIFVRGFFAIENRDGNLYGNVIDILRSGCTVILLSWV